MMNYFVSFVLAIISSMLIDNVVLSRFYGICPFLGVSRKTKTALGMGIAVVAVIILSAAICWPIYTYILVPAGIPFLDTLTYILVIASFVQVVGLIIKKTSPTLYKNLGVYLPLITTNCAVLGVVQGNTDSALDFGMSMANAIGTSVGFLIIIVLFSFIRAKIDSLDVPKSIKGLPIALITAAIMSIAFLGLSGMIS